MVTLSSLTGVRRSGWNESFEIRLSTFFILGLEIRTIPMLELEKRREGNHVDKRPLSWTISAEQGSIFESSKLPNLRNATEKSSLKISTNRRASNWRILQFERSVFAEGPRTICKWKALRINGFLWNKNASFYVLSGIRFSRLGENFSWWSSGCSLTVQMFALVTC